MLFNAMSINNKKSTLQAFIVAQKVDLACLTEIWIRESESITLNPLTSPSYFVLHQLWTDGWDGSILLRGISLQDAFHVSYSLGPALLFKVIGPEGCITSSLWDSALYYMHPLYPPILSYPKDLTQLHKLYPGDSMLALKHMFSLSLAIIQGSLLLRIIQPSSA